MAQTASQTSERNGKDFRENCPVIPNDLLSFLDSAFPDRYPSIAMREREIWFEAGRRSLINLLLMTKKYQDEHADKVLIR